MIQWSNLGLLHCRWIPYCPSHQGSPVCYKGPLSFQSHLFPGTPQFPPNWSPGFYSCPSQSQLSEKLFKKEVKSFRSSTPNPLLASHCLGVESKLLSVTNKEAYPTLFGPHYCELITLKPPPHYSYSYLRDFAFLEPSAWNTWVLTWQVPFDVQISVHEYNNLR